VCESILRSAGVAILATKLDGTITLFNPVAEEWLGWSAAELIGRATPEVFLDREAAAGFALVAASARQTAKPEVSAWTWVRRDGSTLRVCLLLTPLLDAAGSPSGYLGIAHQLSERTPVEDALIESEAKLQTLLDSAPLVIGVLGADRKFKQANRFGRDLLGYEPAELIGKTTRLFYDSDEEYERAGRELYSRAVADSTESVDLRLRRRDGTSIDVMANAAFLDRKRPQAGWVVTLLDVTERNRIAKETRFIAEASKTLAGSLDYRATLTRVAQLSVPFLADWCLVDVFEGPRLRRVAGAHVDPAKEPLLRELERHSELPLSRTPAAVAVRTQAPYLLSEVDDEVIAAHADDVAHGNLIRAIGTRTAMAVPLIAHGQTLGAMSFGSARPGMRYDARSIALADEVARRAAVAIENARLYGEAQDSIRERDEFLSIASHELRTPLTSLTFTVQRLHQGKVALTHEQLRQTLDLAHRQIARLTKLVDDMLDVGRIHLRRVELQLEPVDLAGIAREVLEHLANTLAKAGCAWTLRAPRPVIGRWDASKLSQVMTNLLSNAAKFGSDKPIEVEVALVDDHAHLVVTDHGIGIPTAAIAHVFDKFRRAVSAREYGGLGLGLYIVRSIVEVLDGTVTIESVPGVQTSFIIDLPLAGPGRA
jgi:PAS domain S-box-containing protein